MASAETHGDNLTDGELQSEIELVGDLVVAATSSDGPMPQSEIDRLLGVNPGDVDAGVAGADGKADGGVAEADAAEDVVVKAGVDPASEITG